MSSQLNSLQFEKSDQPKFGLTSHTATEYTQRPNGSMKPVRSGFANLSYPRSRNSNYAKPDVNPKYHSVDEHGQQALFEHDYVPPTLESMAVHPGMEHVVPRLMGLAAQDSLRKFGRLPEADSSLSEHSMPIVKRLAERGVINMPANVEQNHFKKATEHVNEWVNDMHAAVRLDGHHTDPEEVASASRMVRSMLKRGRPTPPQGRQMHFDLGHGA